MSCYRLPLILLVCLLAVAVRAQTPPTPAAPVIGTTSPGSSANAGRVQPPPTTASPPSKTVTFAELLDANPNLPVPLLIVSQRFHDPIPNFPEEMQTKTRTMTFTALATRYNDSLKPAKVGSLTALVPINMTVLNTHPGKPNIYAAMSRGDRMKLLMGSLTAAQWQQVGGETGLGFGDLSEEQKPLFDSIIPQKPEVSKYTVLPPDPEANPGAQSRKYENTDLHPNRQMIRLRLARTTQFVWEDPKAKGLRYSRRSDNLEAAVGSSHLVLNDLVPDYSLYYSDGKSAYGNIIVQELPNRLKAGDLNYSAPLLNPMVALDEIRTVGELIKRVATETHLPLTADARIVGLPVYVKGDEARAGDLLQALALSVTGTFRKVGNAAPNLVYHLTDDVEGIGTQAMQLDRWANVPYFQSKMRLEKSAADASRQHPDRYLAFAPKDALALSPEIAHSIEEGWVKNRYDTGAEYRLSDMPPALRDAAIAAGREVRREGYKGSTEAVHFDIGTRAEWILPGIGTLPLNESPDIPGLGEIALPPESSSNSDSSNPQPITALPTALPRRVLLVAPESPTNAAQVVPLAAKHGFNEVWVQVPNTEKGIPILRAAVQAGNTAHIRVGAAISLLKSELGEPDRTILGETGEEFAARELALKEEGAFQYAPIWRWGMTSEIGKMKGWKIADAAKSLKTVTTLAKIPGLAGLVLRESAAPGYTGPGRNFDYAPEGGQMGYTVAMRLAYIRQQGIDPIDLTGSLRFLLVSLELPFFPSDRFSHLISSEGKTVGDGSSVSLPQRWFDFRDKQNRAFLLDLYTALRKTVPRLPLYLDDRRTPYADLIVGWYGSWDAPEKLPIRDTEVSRDTPTQQKQAKKMSEFALLTAWYYGSGNSPNASADLARTVSRVSGEALKDQWDGVVVDLSRVAGANVARLIQGVPVP